MLTKLALSPNVVKVEAVGGEEGEAGVVVAEGVQAEVGEGEVAAIAAGKRLICNSQKNFA
jgi:hypothetical protein